MSVQVGPHGRERTVLIVEDDPLFRKVLSTVLSSMGFHPLLADSGEAALATASTHHVDIILMDYHLPGMNGIDLARTLHAREISPPMILISGFLTDAMNHEAYEARVSKVLRKPMDIVSLQDTVVRLVEGSEAAVR